MNLKYTLPDREAAALRPLLRKEKMVYCIPCDMTPDGQAAADRWTVVTPGEAVSADWRRGDRNRGLEGRGGGGLQPSGGLWAAAGEGRGQGTDAVPVQHAVHGAVFLSGPGATLFCRGVQREVKSREREKHCPVCGRALPGTNVCVRCSGRWQAFSRLWDLCSRYAAPLLLITLFMAGISALSMAQQSVIRHFIDDVLVPVSGTTRQILIFGGVMLLILAARIGLHVGKTLWSNSLGTRMARDLRYRVFHKINALSMSFLGSRETGELMNRVVEDSARIREFMEQAFADMFTQLFIIIGALIMMLAINWKLALLTLAFVPLALLLVRLFRNKERRLWRQQWRFNDKMNGRLEDVISGIRVVKSFGQEKRETERFQEYVERQTEIQRRNETFWATLYPFVTFIITCGTLFVVYFGGLNVLNDTMTPGQLVQFMAYANMVYMPLQYLSRLPRMIMRVSTALERIYDVLDEESDVKEADKPQAHRIQGEVKFDDVTFGYHSYEPVLEHIDLTIRPGRDDRGWWERRVRANPP